MLPQHSMRRERQHAQHIPWEYEETTIESSEAQERSNADLANSLAASFPTVHFCDGESQQGGESWPAKIGDRIRAVSRKSRSLSRDLAETIRSFASATILPSPRGNNQKMSQDDGAVTLSPEAAGKQSSDHTARRPSLVPVHCPKGFYRVVPCPE